MNPQINDNKPEYYNSELIKRAQAGDKAAMSEMIKKNSPLIHSLLKRYCYLNSSYEDLYQIAVIGMIKAVRKFDFSFETKFSTYAVYLINGEIKRHFRDDGILKVGRKYKSIYMKYRNYRENFINTHGEEPDFNEICKTLEISADELTLALDACRMPEYLENYISHDSDNGDKQYGDVVFQEKDGVENCIELIDLKNIIGELDKEKRQLIVLRYFKHMTQAETAAVLGISQVQVSRKERKIIDELKIKLSESKS